MAFAKTHRVPTGTVLLWTGLFNAIPTGYLICNGAAVSEATYDTLFAIIADKYGGGGDGTFNLPDMRDKFPKGAQDSSSGGGSGGNNEHCHGFICQVSCGNHAHCIRDVACSCNNYVYVTCYEPGSSCRLSHPCHCHCITGVTCDAGQHDHIICCDTCSCQILPPYVEYVFIIKI